jgi:predicted DsbA family dithiol-disulfide isomerase
VSVEKLRQEPDLVISWAYYPLHPETPLKGISVADAYPARREKNSFVQQEIQAIAGELGLPLGKRKMIYNSRRSQELASWADTQEGGQKLHDALYAGYFVDNMDISDMDVLLALVSTAGLDVDSAREAIASGAFAAKVDDDWSRARQQGLTGVPTLLSGETYVLGYHPMERIMRFVNHLRELPQTTA